MTDLISKSIFQLGKFKETPVLGIIRDAPQDAIGGVLNACISGGINFVELTLNSKNALSLIDIACQNFSKDLCIGAGTVLSLTDVKQAANAGAKFIVSPTLNANVAAYCIEKKLAYFPGALTPTEIEKAWEVGATMVKVFPASQMGASYFNTVRGPFNEYLLMAVGGIDSYNVIDYLRDGASAVAIGGSVFTESRMKNKKFNEIQQSILEIVSAVKSFNYNS